MKKNQKFLCTLLSAVMSFSTLAACGGGNGGDNSSDGGVEITPIVAYDGCEVTVTFYHTMGQTLRDILDKYVTEFNEMYPNIKIDAQQIGDYDGVRTQISTELAGKNSPSLAYCYADHVALYNKSKMVLTLDSYIASDAVVEHADGTTETMGYTQAQLDDFVDAYWAEGKAFSDGKMYTLPFQKSSEVLYYNKTYFTEHNLTVPTTWEEMKAVCKTIKETEAADGNNCVPLGYDSESNWFITMCEQYGYEYTSATGSHYRFNTPEVRAFVEEFSNWYDAGYVTTEEIYGSYTSDMFTNTDATKPTAYMCIGSTGGSSYQIPDLVKDPVTGVESAPFEVGVAQIPQVDVNKPKVITQGPSLVLFNKVRQAELNKTSTADAEQEQAAAWLFAKFLTTNVNLQAEFSMQNGYAPVINSVEENAVYKNFLDTADGYNNLQASCVIQALAQKNAYYASPAFDGSSEAREQVGLLLQTCFIKKDIGSQSVADFIKNAFDDVIDELEFNDL